MEIGMHITNNLLWLKVVPNSTMNKLVVENDSLKLYVKAVPDKNKANTEVIAFFKKNFGLRVIIKRGEKSRNKVLEIIV